MNVRVASRRFRAAAERWCAFYDRWHRTPSYELRPADMDACLAAQKQMLAAYHELQAARAQELTE